MVGLSGFEPETFCTPRRLYTYQNNSIYVKSASFEVMPKPQKDNRGLKNHDCQHFVSTRNCIKSMQIKSTQTKKAAAGER